MTEGSATSLYRFYDAAGRLLYVGITERGAMRWREHRKDKAWWPYVVNATVTHYATRREALRAEERAIRDENPMHNVVHNGTVRSGGTPSSWRCDKCGEVIDNGDGYVWCHPKTREWESVHRRCDEHINITGYWIAVERMPTFADWDAFDDHLHTKRWFERESETSWNECQFRAFIR